MNRTARCSLFVAALSLAGCQGSGSGTASVGAPVTPAHSRLVFHGILQNDINLSNLPPGGTGQLMIYDAVTGKLEAQLPAKTGTHLDASSLPAGRAVRVFFVPNPPTP